MSDQYDFAFSFAGEDRMIVEQIRNELQGFRIFYDKDHQSELCGEDLYSYLRSIYMERAKFVVCFLSKHYKQKVWTHLELAAIKERFMSTFFASDFLIPIVLEEEVFLKDIPSFIGYHRYKNVEGVVSLLKEKFNKSLNEDFYLENISHFRDYLLQNIVSSLNTKGFKSTSAENSLNLIANDGERKIYLQPEKFTNLPCLLLSENRKNDPPLAIITWKRTNRIYFTFSVFTDLTHNTFDELSFDELEINIINYLLFGER